MEALVEVPRRAARNVGYYTYLRECMPGRRMRRTKEDAAKTRESIVSAALACFERHGLAQSTMEQIAAEAGVTKGAVYWHFSNKREIFHALRQQVSLPLLDRADTTLLHATDAPALERLARFLDASFEALEGDRRLREALNVMLFKCEYVEAMAEELDDGRRNTRRLVEALESAYADAREEGTLRADLTPRAAAVETIAFLTGLTRLWLLDRGHCGFRRDARAALRSHLESRRRAA
jgi:TetR/AcrR family acrAB operon transcriptional repressor